MYQITCDGHTLIQAARKGSALFTHRHIHIQILGQIGQVTCLGAVTQGIFHLLIYKVLTQGNVLTDGGIEQKYILLDVAYFLLGPLGGIIPYILPFIKDLSL